MASSQDATLEYRTAPTQIERALQERLSLAFQERRPPVATLSALRSEASKYVMHRDLIYVQDEGVCYRWLDTAEGPDDDRSLIRPLDTARGAWVRCTEQALYAPRGHEQALPLCAIPTGYVRAVQLYQGPAESEEAFERIFGVRPAILIQWIRTNRRQESLAPALYRAEFFFRLLCISYHPRHGPDALLGSELPQEAAEDPGLHQLMGDASDCCLGASDEATGYQHLVPGVIVVQPWADDEVVEESLAERLFIGATHIRVVTYLHRPDYDTVPLTHVSFTTQHVNERGQDVGLHNVLLEGYNVVWPVQGLIHPVEYGQAKVAGQLVASSPALVVFPAERDTYRDLKPDGTFYYQAVAVGAPPPLQQPGTLRVGVTTTNATDIVTDSILAPQITDFAGPDEISS